MDEQFGIVPEGEDWPINVWRNTNCPGKVYIDFDGDQLDAVALTCDEAMALGSQLIYMAQGAIRDDVEVQP